MFLTMGIVVWGISGGIERASKMLMPVLFILLLFLMATSIATGGISKTLAYLFTWNLSTLTPASILEALGHAFFSLSLGMGAMLTYGSYLNRDADIVKSALYITILDTSVALLACLMLFPIILHFNLQPGSASIGILFTTLPVVFNQMPMGNLVSIIFFCLLAFAALTSAISLLEVVVSYMIDEKGWSRKSSSLLVGSLIFLLGLPAALCNGASPFFSKIVIFKNEGKWMNWFDSFDYLATNWFLPLGGLFIALCVGWALTDEDRLGEFTLIDGNSLIYRYFRFSIRYLAPVLVFVVLLNKIGLI
jgi:NSS family neurotransmitter:Na+ symporter